MSSRPDPAHRSLPLLAQLGNTVVRELKEVMAESGIHPRQSAILNHLVDTDGGASQQALSELIAVHRSAMVLLIDDLEAKGYVERVRSSVDRRAYDVVITQTGRTAVDELERPTREYEDEFFAALSAEEREELRRLLVKIAEARSLGFLQATRS